jgi:PST family polysaccharide transporter
MNRRINSAIYDHNSDDASWRNPNMSETESTDRTSGGGRLQPDSLTTSIVILLVVSVVQRSVGFGRGVFFCRWLAPEELGQWDMAYSFLLLASPVVVLGLPGSFGRYLERYRQRQQLRTFLRRTAIWTTTLAALAVTTLVWAAPSFSELILGRPEQTTLVKIIGVSLLAVILHHFLEALFAGLRKFRIVSTMQFFQSLGFATISLSLLTWWQTSATSIVIAYGAACLISATGMLLWTGRDIAHVAEPDNSVPHREFWPPLVRFAIWIWFTNLLAQLFAVADRYMLLHCSGLDTNTALTQVGNYHSSRIVPLLLVSLADLLAGVVMPYMSHDWERGLRRQVSDRLNLVLKLTSLGMLAASVFVLWISPFLFRVAFRGRYEEGLAVLPWTLTYCVWYSLVIVAQSYVWCAERTKIGSLPLVCGLLLNIGLNLILLPIWGLLGAVVATTISTGVALTVLYWLNHCEGMELQPGLLILSVAPIALGGGVWAGTTTLLALAAIAPFSRVLINDGERRALDDFLRRQLELAYSFIGKRTKSLEATPTA